MRSRFQAEHRGRRGGFVHRTKADGRRERARIRALRGRVPHEVRVRRERHRLLRREIGARRHRPATLRERASLPRRRREPGRRGVGDHGPTRHRERARVVADGIDPRVEIVLGVLVVKRRKPREIRVQTASGQARGGDGVRRAHLVLGLLVAALLVVGVDARGVVRACGERPVELLHLLPAERLARVGHRDEDAARLVGGGEARVAAPHDGELASIGVDPERVRVHLHGLRRPAATLGEGARDDAGEPRRERRVVGVQVLEHERLVPAEKADLLIRRRRVEVARVQLLRHRVFEAPRVELRGALGPRRRDGAEGDGRRDLAPVRGARGPARLVDAHPRGPADRLQVREALAARHPGGVRRAGAAGGAIVGQEHLRERERWPHAARRHDAVAEDGDRLVHAGDGEPRCERGDGAAVRRVGVAHEHHVRARLERDQIARRDEAPRGVRALVDVHLAHGDGVTGEADLAGREIEGRLHDDGEGPALAIAAPYHTIDEHGRESDDVHSGRRRYHDARPFHQERRPPGGGATETR